MKYELPTNHGLSATIEQHLLFRDPRGTPAVSDVQYEALAAGVARGDSALVVSPTSTGKTQIALWAIASGVERGCNTVYLVTHRALAKQKFEDFKTQLLGSFLGSNAASLVVATGDYVEDAEGIVPSEPLRAPLLVATYEKYLALLSASGVPRDMSSTVVVCDEIQLLGDASRGQNVEVLLTLLRNAGWKQFVGLSAVLQQRDATDLANWLSVKLVALSVREKHLRYECWTEGRMVVASSDKPDQTEEAALPAGVTLDPISALLSLLGQRDSPRPIIVFCMKKQDTYDLARRFVDTAYKGQKGQMSLAFDGLPATSANEFLTGILEQRVACHNADLTDEERHVVEQRLLEGRFKAFAGAKPNPQAKANWLRDTSRSWKSNQRAKAAERQARRAKKCPRADFVERFYLATGNDFEQVFEDLLAYLKVDCKRLDDKTKTGAPDYLVQLPGSPPLVVELKSRETGKLVDYNRAVEVLAASEIHGYRDAFCVTLCQPGVDPSVSTVIASCGRLSVIEAIDLGEALLRYCEGTLSGEQLYRWLATPGQALAADLPYREYA